MSGRALYSIYSSTKAVIVYLIQRVYKELSYNHIRINAINPDRTDTHMRRDIFGLNPKHILLNPVKVARVSLQSLLSDISGQIVDVRKEED